MKPFKFNGVQNIPGISDRLLGYYQVRIEFKNEQNRYVFMSGKDAKAFRPEHIPSPFDTK